MASKTTSSRPCTASSAATCRFPKAPAWACTWTRRRSRSTGLRKNADLFRRTLWQCLQLGIQRRRGIAARPVERDLVGVIGKEIGGPNHTGVQLSLGMKDFEAEIIYLPVILCLACGFLKRQLKPDGADFLMKCTPGFFNGLDLPWRPFTIVQLPAELVRH